MNQSALKWLRAIYNKTITSIAFIPALVALAFLLLSYFMITFDFSEAGKEIKSNSNWLKLKDAETARNLISVITGGVISLTVFSFSMVMILLNQAASQMSNRTLDKLIGNRFQQTVLGFYIGTIVYALFLLSTIRDIDSGIYVPAISTYLLITFTVIDIFLFIYFLHYVTQSVKYEVIIHRIYDSTRKSLEKNCCLTANSDPFEVPQGVSICAYTSGIFQGFASEALLSVCQKEDIVIYFLYPTGTMVLKGVPLFTIKSKKKLPENLEQNLRSLINIHRGQDIQSNYYYGFRHLMEVAVKALSPGINDPGTAVLSLQALSDLLAFRLHNYPATHVKDNGGVVRIITKERSFNEIFTECIFPIWNYGREDQVLITELHHTLTQLLLLGKEPVISKLNSLVKKAMIRLDSEN